jgi:uncharacterized protein YdeI (YjbR/CyaY-like superfamily)
MKIIFFTSQSELYKWLEKNHDKVQELWFGFYKKNSKPTRPSGWKTGITYSEVLDEALCFGWIDGIRKSIDEISYTIRFTPRKARSIWSNVNIKRVGELSKLGLMQPSGLKVFNERDEKKSGIYSFEQKNSKLDVAYEKKFRSNKKAWDFFQAQAPYYQRTTIYWVMSAKKVETRLKRLAVLIKDSEKGQRIALLKRTAR